MLRGGKIFSIIATAAVFIGLEIAAFSILRHNSIVQDVWMSRFAHRIMSAVWENGGEIRDYFSLKKDNEALALRNSMLLAELTTLKESISDSAAVEKMSNFGGSDFDYIPASIVKISRGTQHNYFIIDKGYEDGVVPQSGVITDKGVIGIIDAVDRNYSLGLSFMNSGINISTRIGHDGAVGPLSWDGHSPDGAYLREIPLQFKYEKGDTVWTSGYSSMFPSDVPVGITGDAKVINGAVNEIKITLFEDFSSLRYVTVVANTGMDEIIRLEAAQEGIQ